MAHKCKETGLLVEVFKRKEWPEPEDFKALAEMCGDRFAYGPDGMFIVEWGLGNSGEPIEVSSTEIKPNDLVVKHDDGRLRVYSRGDFLMRFEEHHEH